MLTDQPRFPIKHILAFGFLPSPIKRWVYRLLGYQIGPGVSLGIGSVIVGKSVAIGAHTSIGFFTIIRGDFIRIGPHVQIGAATILDTPHLEIGEGTKINEQVFVGGLQFHDSKLVVGRNCQIMQMTFINPARSITIGDDTGIGGDSLVFGHTSFLSKFEGYSVDFEPIEIGNSVSIAWRVFILPGTKIGDGAVVGANSLVRGSIPGRCMAIGFPARVVQREPDFPKILSHDDKERILREIIDDMLKFLQGYEFRCAKSGDLCEVWPAPSHPKHDAPRPWRLLSVTHDISENLAASWRDDLDALVSLKTIPPAVRRRLESKRVLWIDLEKKERPDFGHEFGEEVVQFFKRYGVRLFRDRAEHASTH